MVVKRTKKIIEYIRLIFMSRILSELDLTVV